MNFLRTYFECASVSFDCRKGYFYLNDSVVFHSIQNPDSLIFRIDFPHILWYIIIYPVIAQGHLGGYPVSIKVKTTLLQTQFRSLCLALSQISQVYCLHITNVRDPQVSPEKSFTTHIKTVNAVTVAIVSVYGVCAEHESKFNKHKTMKSNDLCKLHTSNKMNE